MLSKVLSKNTCADCRFCCAFRRSSLWETPKFDRLVLDKYSKDYNFINYGDYGRMMLGEKYETDDPKEEVPCYFLDPNKGCILSEEEKPFECKIWPLRLMKKEDELVIALAETCPEINKVGLERMKELVETDLKEAVIKKASERPFMVEKFRDNYQVICNVGSEKKTYVKVFSMHSSVFNDQELFDENYEKLSDYRKDKVDKLKQANDKKMALAAGILLDKALKSIGIIEDVRIVLNAYGKPYLEDYEDLFFNISHSHGLVVVAISNEEIGVDAEAVSIAKMAVAGRFFSDKEKSYLNEICQEDKKNYEFFRLWTAKEAIMKLTGLGMKLPLDAVSIDLSFGKPRVESKDDAVLPDALYLYDCPVKEDYVCTLASNVSFANIEIISYNIKDDELKGFSL